MLGNDKADTTLEDLAAELERLDPTNPDGLASLGDALARLGQDRAVAAEVRGLLQEAAVLAAAPPTDAAHCAEVHDALGRILAVALQAQGTVQGATAEGATDTTPAWEVDAADADLVDELVAEARDLLDEAERALLDLEARPGDMEALNTVFRAFHTVKGGAAIVGFRRLAALCHHAESAFGAIRSGAAVLDADAADLALRSIDAVRALLDALGETATPGHGVEEPRSFTELLSRLQDGEQVDSPVPATVAARPRLEPDEPPRRRSEEATVRVGVDRLDSLVTTVGELVIAHSMVAAHADGADEALVRQVTHTSKIVRELQDLAMSMRMVPLRRTFQRAARAARDVARRQGKDVELVVTGAETEIDRNMVDLVADPLLHMVRNAVDHGIEPTDVRRRGGKEPAGKVWIRASHTAGNVVIELRDDGRGLDPDRLVARAVSRGLIPSDATLTTSEAFGLIFEPGFSTRDTVTDVSGRGVGMDVVKKNVELMRGHVEVTSEPGGGTTFSLRLPLTLAITDGMLVRVGDERYVVPTVGIDLSCRPEPAQISSVGGNGALVDLGDRCVPVFRMHDLLGSRGCAPDPTEAILVVVNDGDQECALLVDELLGQHQVVAKPLGQALGRIAGVSGAAILNDGRVGLIVDTAELSALARR